MWSSAFLPTLIGLFASAAVGIPITVGAHAVRPDLSEFSQGSAVRGTLRTTSRVHYDGREAYEARYCGGPGNGYARGVMRVNWIPGSSWSYGVALLIPRSFGRAQEGEVDLLRWDNYPLFGPAGDFGGIVLYSSDHRARLERGMYSGASETIGRPFSLPRGRWFWLEVQQRLSAGPDAESHVTVDDRPVITSTAPNTYGRPIKRVRFGLVAIDEQSQTRGLRLFFDRAAVQPWTIGSLPGSERRAQPRARRLTRVPEQVPAACR